jgi:hypothetical protein
MARWSFTALAARAGGDADYAVLDEGRNYRIRCLLRAALDNQHS